GVRRFDVGDAGRPVRRRRGQLVQRRPTGPRGAATRSVLRAGDLVAGARARPGWFVHPHEHDAALRGTAGSARPDRAHLPRRRPRDDHFGAAARGPLIRPARSRPIRITPTHPIALYHRKPTGHCSTPSMTTLRRLITKWVNIVHRNPPASASQPTAPRARGHSQASRNTPNSEP